jgi:outer membrane protein OmpA-like peptidoglycan-associated protein
VISSGLSTSGGFDLRSTGWDAIPGSIAAQLKARGLLPDLVGYHVVFSGLGGTADRQPPLPLPQQSTLINYWEAICQASGAASCSVDDTDRPEPPSRSAIPVPLVPVPAVISVKGPDNRTVTTLPDTLLFSFDSSTLLPFADTVLRPLAQRARSQHQLVSITGYASPDGGTKAYNLALSARRANAVRNRLIALGLPAGQITQATGLGTAGQSPAACLVHNQLDEAKCQQLRRVVIILSSATVTS